MNRKGCECKGCILWKVFGKIINGQTWLRFSSAFRSTVYFIWLYRWLLGMLETKYVGYHYKFLVTDLAILITNIDIRSPTLTSSMYSTLSSSNWLEFFLDSFNIDLDIRSIQLRWSRHRYIRMHGDILQYAKSILDFWQPSFDIG